MLDVRKFIQEEFGGVSSAGEKMRKHDPSISDGTVQKWCERNSLPGPRLALLIAIRVRDTKNNFDFTKYVQGFNPCKSAKKKHVSSGEPSGIFD